MDWPQVQERIAAGESVQTEFKRTLELRQVGRAICAFGNTDGGLLVLGVDDAGAVVGLRDNLSAARERLASFFHTGCNVPVRARCDHVETPQGAVLWVEVPKQRGLEPLRCDGRVWVRRDRSTTEPSAMELQELFNAFGFVLTEDQTIIAATVDDIDVDGFRRHLARQELDLDEPQPTLEDDLHNFGVIAEFDGALHPTLYGLLAFGKHPQRFPGTGNFWINCVAYSGTDQAADLSTAREAKGRLDEQVASTFGWARAFGHGERYVGLVREEIPLLPAAAIREAVVNAVAHRDYAIIGSTILLEVFTDRVQVTSPGALPNHLSIAKVRKGGVTRSRNEQMVNFLLARRFMERRGRGYLLMRQAMREFNGTEPELTEDREARFFTVTFRLA